MALQPGFPQYDPLTGLTKKKKTGGQLYSPTFDPNAGNNVFGPTVGDQAGVNYLSPFAQTAGGTGGAGGPAPLDIKSLLNSLLDPLKSELNAQGVADIASRNAGVNRALVQFGEVPNFGEAGAQLGFNLGEVVDPATAEAAANNPYSATKRIAQEQSDRLREIKNALAARGALRSGELGYQLQRHTEQSGREQYDARSQLLDYLAGVQQAYADAERQRKTQLAGAGSSAIEQLLGLFGSLPTGGATASPTGDPQRPKTYADLGVTPDAITSAMVQPPSGVQDLLRNVKPPRRTGGLTDYYIR